MKKKQYTKQQITILVFNFVKNEQGVCMNDIARKFATLVYGKSNPIGIVSWPRLYSVIRMLRAENKLHMTGDKKNRGLYTTSKRAQKNTGKWVWVSNEK